MPSTNYRTAAIAALFAALASVASHASGPPKPAAPQVTAGAGLKQLIFDWDRVPRATHYQLFEDLNGSGFTPKGEPVTATRKRVNVAVHLHPWATARYKVAVCNAAGCADSSEIDPSGLASGTIGYLKASNTDEGDQFGRASVLSDDGRTLVVSAGLERSGATGVNGDQSDDSVQNAGAVYVFRRNGGAWTQEAYLKADPTHADQFFGFGYPIDYRALAVSADGSIVAVGASGESAAAGSFVGAVYLFGRDAAGQWSLLQKLQAPTPASHDFFGLAVDISGDGNTVRALGLGPRDGEGIPQGQHHIFARSGGTWTLQATLEIPHQGVNFCNSGELSGDGTTVVFFCQSYAPEGSRVITWKRSGDTWTQLPAYTPILSFRSQEVVLSYNANRLAFRDSSHELSTNVRVFHWDGAQWIEEAAIETPAGLDTGAGTWGAALALDRNGGSLVIGDLASDALGAGVSDTIQPGGDNDGAVFLYERAGGAWQFRRQIKAPNPGWGDGFGLSISLSGNGRTLAVGAVWEDGAATGIDGDQTSDDAEEAGAVYLY